MKLGIDYGKKRIGLALGESIPRPFLVLDNVSETETLGKIIDICKEHKVEKIIIGLPEAIDEESTILIADIKKLGSSIEKSIKAEVVYEPEAYSSVEAIERLKQLGQYDQNNKGQIDMESATLLLEQYINREES